MRCSTCPIESLSDAAQELAVGCQGAVLYDVSTSSDTLIAGPFCRAQTIIDKQEDPERFESIKVISSEPQATNDLLDDIDAKIGRAISTALFEFAAMRSANPPELVLADHVEA